MEPRLRWNGNLDAQRQCDDSYCRLKDKPKKKKQQRIRQPKRKRFSGYHEYMQSPEWQKKRQKAFRFHGKRCSICGSTNSLDVHHVTYKRLYREPMTDLTILCRGCHGNHHEGSVVGAIDPMTAEFLQIIS